MTSLVDKVLAIAAHFDVHPDVPYAFGGAIALAYATADPRGTRDIDVNVFVGPRAVDAVFAALPAGVVHGEDDRRVVERDEQVRLWWEDTPIDLFFAAHPFHLDAAGRARRVEFVGRTIPVLDAGDLAVFKVLFDRPKDWIDIATMVESGTLDVRATAAVVENLLGPDERVARLRALR